MKLSKVIKVDNPQLFDIAIGAIQDGLVSQLSWLDHSFGKAERLVKVVKGKKIYTPNIHLKGNEYLPLIPNADLGNFSFFLVDEPIGIDWRKGNRNRLTAKVSVIFWFDLRRVGSNGKTIRNLDAVTAEILKALSGVEWVSFGSLSISNIYNKAESIYKGFTIDEVDNQYLMHPYGGLRFEGELQIQESC